MRDVVHNSRDVILTLSGSDASKETTRQLGNVCSRRAKCLVGHNREKTFSREQETLHRSFQWFHSVIADTLSNFSLPFKDFLVSDTLAPEPCRHQHYFRYPQLDYIKRHISGCRQTSVQCGCVVMPKILRNHIQLNHSRRQQNEVRSRRLLAASRHIRRM